MTSSDARDDIGRKWYDRKSALMEISLCKQHEIVMHAIVGYAVGGPLDLYYYPDELPGTAIATRLHPDSRSPAADRSVR